jgi:hypothetical protein
MMYETPDMRSVALIFASLCLVAFATSSVGCASNSGPTDDGAEKPAQGVSGEPPSPQEDTQKSLPDGPKVDIGRASAKARTNRNQPDELDGQADTPGASFTRSQVEAFMQQGPPYALTMVRVAPERNDGAFQGFKITKMKPAAAKTVAPHIKAGDIITHINGVRMEKPDDYLNAWKLLSEVDTIRIDFVRGGASEHARWNIK